MAPGVSHGERNLTDGTAEEETTAQRDAGTPWKPVGEAAAGASPPARLTLADLRGLSPADLRDLAELRREHEALERTHASLEREQQRRDQDLARLTEENRYLRDQLGQALAGWRDAQEKAAALTPTPETGHDAPADTPLESPAPPAPPLVTERQTETPPRAPLWGRLWAWLGD